jgi:hypothetical protein
MYARHVFAILAVTALALPVGAADPSAEAGQLPASQGTAGGAGLDPATRKNLEPIQLSDSQVKGFFDAADELSAIGKKWGEASQAGSANPQELATAMQATDTTLEILGKHGFKNVNDFQRVAYNVAMAYSVLEQGGTEAVQKRFAEAKAEREKAIAQLRERMPPDQVQMLEQQLSQMEEMAGMMKDVPAANVELMRKYQSRMKKLQQE